MQELSELSFSDLYDMLTFIGEDIGSVGFGKLPQSAKRSMHSKSKEIREEMRMRLYGRDIFEEKIDLTPAPDSKKETEDKDPVRFVVAGNK